MFLLLLPAFFADLNVSYDEILKVVQQGGFIGMLVFILLGGAKQWWVWGHQLRESELREAEWKAMALRNFEATEKSAEIAEILKGVAQARVKESDATTRRPAPRKRPTARTRRPRED